MNLLEFCEWVDGLPIDDSLKQEIKDNASTVVYTEIADSTDLSAYDGQDTAF